VVDRFSPSSPSFRIVWNVDILEFSVDVGSEMVVVKFFSNIVPKVVENPPTFTLYFSVDISAGLLAVDDEVVGISSNVLLL
jgi:hypothetical protein